MFVPTTKKVTIDDKGKKNLVKFSIKDSQNTFMVFCDTVTQVEEFINNRNNQKFPIQPFILIVGTPLQPKEIIVYLFRFSKIQSVYCIKSNRPMF